MGCKDLGLPPAAPEPEKSEKPQTEKPRGPGLSPWRMESPLLPSAAHQAPPPLIEPQDASRGEAGWALQELSGHFVQGIGAALCQVDEAGEDGGSDGSRWLPDPRPGPATPRAGAEETASEAAPQASPGSLPHQPWPALGPRPWALPPAAR